jgi:hypothetical protein
VLAKIIEQQTTARGCIISRERKIMKRVFEEKREVTERINRTVCDICGEVVMGDKPYIRMYATDGDHLVSTNDGLEICTPDCLAKNIDGIKLILDGKMIPSVQDSPREYKKYDDEKCEALPTLKLFKPIYIGK